MALLHGIRVNTEGLFILPAKYNFVLNFVINLLTVHFYTQFCCNLQANTVHNMLYRKNVAHIFSV